MATRSLEAVLEAGQRLGFLGPGPVEPHLRHARGLAELLGTFSGAFLDLGSGSGLPGLVLARAWPEAHAVLLDAGERRCRFLADAVRSLELGERVQVRCGRAEDLARTAELRDAHPLVVARGFGPPPVVAECGVGLVAPGGALVVTEPPPGVAGPSRTVDRWPVEELAELGLVRESELRGADVGAVVLRKTGPTAPRWPRRAGVPRKRPLWEPR